MAQIYKCEVGQLDFINVDKAKPRLFLFFLEIRKLGYLRKGCHDDSVGFFAIAQTSFFQRMGRFLLSFFALPVAITVMSDEFFYVQ